jgi:HD-GYP domain-containing protein (c-di-GMP phosphodiesterase class II)
VEWTNKAEEARFLARNVTGSVPRRLRRFVQVAVSDVDELHHSRCDRGAEIAAMLAFPAATQEAVRALDEHWDGRGRPRGLRGDEIPVLARIVCLAQTTEIFAGTYGVEAALAMAAERRGSWFDPALVDALLGLRGDERLWRLVSGQDASDPLAGLEPDDLVLDADESRIDRVTAAFGLIIDAKSPFTARHSEGVAAYAVDIGTELGLSASALRDLAAPGCSTTSASWPPRT